MKKDIEQFIKEKRIGVAPDWVDDLVTYLIQEKQWIRKGDEHARILRILNSVLSSKIDSAGRASKDAKYNEGFVEGLRESREIIKDNLQS
jgi:hypothetical protein